MVDAASIKDLEDIELPGYLYPDFDSSPHKYFIKTVPTTHLSQELKDRVPLAHKKAKLPHDPAFTIHDARALQATYPSASAFFEEYGFCLLKHKTAVKEWNTKMENVDNDIVNVY